MKPRLFHKVWLALVLAAWISVCGGAFTARVIHEPASPMAPPVRAYALQLAQRLPTDETRLQQAIDNEAEVHHLALAVYSAEGLLRGATTDPPLGPPRSREDHWIGGPSAGGMAVHLSDGGWVIVGQRHPSLTRIFHHLSPVLLVVCGLLALAAWPIARHLTRRVEALRRAVDDLGQGDLSTRVTVSGSDEVAQLAHSFNQSAARIEALVDGQRRVLAAASHELRSPLARLRMAVALGEESPEELASQLPEMERDIAELDELIGDVLLASRIDAGAQPVREAVQLGVLAREEATRVGATVTGECTVLGDPRMLRRLLRNLLDNATRHGAAPIEVVLHASGLSVRDHGPGVPAAQRDRVFEPFYRPQGHAEADGGVGLGLSLVRRIARHHGGDARVEDAQPGTRVVVDLPG